MIAERLVTAGMYRNPQVTIQLTESPNQVVTVVGEMHGTVPVVGQKRLLDVLSAAGGLPLTASHTITINRPGVDQPIIVNLGTDPARSALANIPVFPHDTMVVSRVGVVYMLGAFRTQGAIPLNQNSPLTLMQVAALGGGPGFEGKYDDLRIIRTVGYDRKVVRVDIEEGDQGQGAGSGAGGGRHRVPAAEQLQGGDQGGRHRDTDRHRVVPDLRPSSDVTTA